MRQGKAVLRNIEWVLHRGHLISKNEIRLSAAIRSSLGLGIDVWVARFVYVYYRPD